MRNKLVYLLFAFSAILIILNLDVSSNGIPEAKTSTPEETLNTYIDAIREGNLDKVLESYYSDRADFKFHLPGPINIEKHEIVKKKIYSAQMAKRYVAIPVAQAGDVELDVKEYIDGREEIFTYLLRQINQEWKIISHSGWDQPD